MSLIVIGARNPVSQKLIAYARQDRSEVLPVYHRCVPKGLRDEGAVAIDTTNPKDLGAILGEGDTVVLVLSERPDSDPQLLTARLHAVLAGILGRKIRLVILDGFLPDVAHIEADRTAPPSRSDGRLRQFFWAEDVRSFARQNGSAVSILRTGPMYGPESGVLLDDAFWRQVLRGGAVRTPLSADQKQNFLALEDAAHALYLMASDTAPPQNGVEELHVPGQDAISISELVSLGAQAAGTQAFIRPPPYPLLVILRKWVKQWRDREEHGRSLGRASAQMTDAFSQRFGLALTPHETGVRKTILALRKSD